MKRKGVEDKFKIAIFDDVPASWMAARNLNLYNKYTSAVFSQETLKDMILQGFLRKNYSQSRLPMRNLYIR